MKHGHASKATPIIDRRTLPQMLLDLLDLYRTLGNIDVVLIASTHGNMLIMDKGDLLYRNPGIDLLVNLRPWSDDGAEQRYIRFAIDACGCKEVNIIQARDRLFLPDSPARLFDAAIVNLIASRNRIDVSRRNIFHRAQYWLCSFLSLLPFPR